MKINKNNYEVFFIDFYDGNLTAEQSAELFLFLESHPELKEEFDNFSNIQLEIPELHFPDRDSLKREQPHIANIDEQLIASLEGDISYDEKMKLESFMATNPQLKKEEAIYKATVSAPDLSVVYPDKKSLKKPVPFYIVYRNEIRFGIAAALLLGFIASTVIVFNRTMEKQSIQVAEEIPAPASSQPFTSDSLDIAAPVSQMNNLPIEKIQKTADPLTAEKNKKTAHGQTNKQNNQQVKETQVILEAPIQIAEVVPATQLPAMVANTTPAVQKTDNVSQPVAGNAGEKYLTVWEALRQSSEKNLNKLLAKEEPVLAYADANEDTKPTLVDVVSKGLEKVSNDKVKLDADKQSGRFSFSAGNFKIEHK